MTDTIDNAAAAAPRDAIISEREQLHWFDMIGGERAALHVTGAESGGTYSILETEAVPGAAAPLHYHAEDEIFYVLEGTMTFRLGDVISDVEPGSIVVAPAGVHHAWKNHTDSVVRMLVLFSPGGVERMFTQIAGLDLPELVELASTYGTFVVGPPLD